MALTGNEVVEVIGVQPNGAPSSVPERATTQQIAALAKVRSKVSLTDVLGHRWSSGPNVGASQQPTGSPNITLSTIFNLEVIPGWVRFVFANDSAAAWTVSNAIYAPSSTFNDGYNPTNAAGAADTTLWQAVTFNNSGADVDMLDQLVAPITGAAIASAGSGGTNGTATLTLATNSSAGFDVVSNNSPSAVRPTFTGTIAGGVLTGVSVASTGSGLTFLPPNPVMVSGGGLTGATLTLSQTPVLSISVPPSAIPSQPALVYSDWMPVSPLVPTDGTFGALVALRVYSSGYPRYVNLAGAPAAAVNRKFQGGYANGTNAATIPASSQTFSSWGIPCAHTVQYIASVPGLSVLATGDSILSGPATVNGISGPVIRGCSLASTAAVPVSFIDSAIYGGASASFLTNAWNEVMHYKPNVLVIQTWSENDPKAMPNTQQTADVGFARAMALAYKARMNGIAVILTTAAPVYYNNPTGEVFRTSINAKVRNACASGGFYLWDLDAIWGTGATPNAYQTAYNSGDNTHPNDAACAAAGAVLAQTLSLIAQ
jgi:hypothetical protein